MTQVSNAHDGTMMSGSANQGSATAPPANTPLSREVLDAYFARHVWYEQQIDVDGTMSTMAPDCWEEYLPLNYRMTNESAVRAMYERVLKKAHPLMAGSTALSMSYGDSHIVTEKDVLIQHPDGRQSMMRVVAVVVFDPATGDVTSERCYFDNVGAAVMQEALGDDFAQTDGVERF